MQSAMDVLQQAFPSGLADSLSDFLANSSAGQWAKKQMNSSFKTEAAAYVQTVAVGTMASEGSLGMIPVIWPALKPMSFTGSPTLMPAALFSEVS